MKQGKLYRVYRLFDKRYPTITHYVGLTSNLKMRFAQHLACKDSNAKKNAWVQTPGVELGKEVIEVCMTIQEGRERETYWINYLLDQGMPLTNQLIPMSASDKENHVYYNVGIPFNSHVYQKLLRDAQETGMDIPKLLVLRLGDYYHKRRTPVSKPVSTTPVMPYIATRARVNAMAALKYW